MTATDPAVPPHVCAQCGTVIAASGGRCPQCGLMQPGGLPPITAPPPYLGSRPPPSLPPPKKSAAPMIAVGGAALVLAGIVAIAALRGPAATTSSLPSAAVPAAPTTAPSSAHPDPGGLVPDLSDMKLDPLLQGAEKKALAWHRDAQLVAIQVGPVVEGRLDATKGTRVEILHGEPTPGRLGPGSPVGTKQLTVLVTHEGSKVEELQGEAGAKAIAEPTCVLEEAWRRVVASGVPSSSELSLRYSHSPKHDRAVWVASVAADDKLTRTLDGRTCTILLR